MFNYFRKELDWGGRKLVLETGKIARQADGAVMVSYGDTIVLCTAVGDKGARIWNLSEGSMAVPNWKPTASVSQQSAKSVAVSADGRWAAISENSRVRLFELPDSLRRGSVREVTSPDAPIEFPGTIRVLAFSPDGAWLAAAGTATSVPDAPRAPSPAIRARQSRITVWKCGTARRCSSTTLT